MTPAATARRILSSGDVLTATNAELRAILEAYLESEAAIRELQQAACDRDGVPMPSQRAAHEARQAERQSLADWLEWWANHLIDQNLWAHPYPPTPEQFRRWAEVVREQP